MFVVLKAFGMLHSDVMPIDGDPEHNIHIQIKISSNNGKEQMFNATFRASGKKWIEDDAVIHEYVLTRLR